MIGFQGEAAELDVVEQADAVGAIGGGGCIARGQALEEGAEGLNAGLGEVGIKELNHIGGAIAVDRDFFHPVVLTCREGGTAEHATAIQRGCGGIDLELGAQARCRQELQLRQAVGGGAGHHRGAQLARVQSDLGVEDEAAGILDHPDGGVAVAEGIVLEGQFDPLDAAILCDQPRPFAHRIAVGILALGEVVPACCGDGFAGQIIERQACCPVVLDGAG